MDIFATKIGKQDNNADFLSFLMIFLKVSLNSALSKIIVIHPPYSYVFRPGQVVKLSFPKTKRRE